MIDAFHNGLAFCNGAMIIELTEEEREELVRLVSREVSDLGPEIRHQ